MIVNHIHLYQVIVKLNYNKRRTKEEAPEYYRYWKN